MRLPRPLHTGIQDADVPPPKTHPGKIFIFRIDNIVVIVFIDLMTMTQKKWFRITSRLLAAASLLPLGACGIFTLRHRHWEKSIQRGEDGVAEHARSYKAGRGDTALLLVHGFGDGPEVWRPLSEPLVSRGYHIRAMRLPGWGEALAVKRTVSSKIWLEAVAKEIRELRATHDRVYVLAHSLGGCIMAHLLHEKDPQIDGLVLYAPMYDIADDRSPLISTRSWFNLGRWILPRRMTVESLFPDHTRVADPRPRNKRDPFVPLHVFDVLYEMMDTFAELPPHSRVPIRLVLPGEDHVVRTDITLKWYTDLDAPSKTLFHVPEAGHVLPLDIDPEAEAHRVALWIDNLNAATNNDSNPEPNTTP